MFLRAHPGWTWRDLEDAPADVIDLMRLFDLEAAVRPEPVTFDRG